VLLDHVHAARRRLCKKLEKRSSESVYQWVAEDKPVDTVPTAEAENMDDVGHPDPESLGSHIQFGYH